MERNSQFFFLEARENYKHGPSDGMLIETTGTIIDPFREISPEKWDELSLKEAFEKMASTLSTRWAQDSNQIVDLAKASRASVQHFLRWALTGGRPGPTLTLTMSILGRDESLKRIEDAATVLEKMTFEASDSSTSHKLGQSDIVGTFGS